MTHRESDLQRSRLSMIPIDLRHALPLQAALSRSQIQFETEIHPTGGNRYPV
jgi:hypothetical protein